MSISLTRGSKQLLPSLRFAGCRLPTCRSTSKIAVEIEDNLFTQLENNDLKPRFHPGKIKPNRVELPDHISRALAHVTRDHPVKTILRDSQKLNQYIHSRHPPADRAVLKSRMSSIVDEVEERMPLENLKDLSEEEQSKWRERRQKYIQRIMATRSYGWKPIIYGAYEALVYAIGRGAMEYGVLMRILKELAMRDVNYKPRSYFDFGSGVGTGMWAASTLWKNTIFEYYNVDSSRDMNNLSELILCDGNEDKPPSLKNVFYRQFLPELETKYDLVISSYALFELPSAEKRKEVILNLWRKCEGYLVIVEEGTRRGHQLVNEARDYILKFKAKDEGHVFAPCPHSFACPRLTAEEDRTPCNFEAIYAPLRLGNVTSDWLTTRYSYVVLKKGDATDSSLEWPRLVRPTLVRSKHIICRMCTSEGKLQEIIFTHSKHGTPAYRCAKASDWGDRLPVSIGAPLEIATKSDKIKEKMVKREIDEKNENFEKIKDLS